MRRLARRESLGDVPLHVLDHDDGVVDDDADGEHEAEQRQHVEGEPEDRHGGERADQRHGDGEERDQARAPGLEEQDDHDHDEENRLEHNSVGAFLMYSRNLTVRRNLFARNRGPSGYGMGLKDMDGVVCEDNLFIGNRVGLYLDNSPGSLHLSDHYSGNFIAYNDIGVAFLPAVKRNAFSDNAFIDNIEQVAVMGQGAFEGNHFTVAGRGNYWSDYAGMDLRGDGVGDTPYRARQWFESLGDRIPELRFFWGSAAVAAVELSYPISHAGEARRLRSREYHDRIAHADGGLQRGFGPQPGVAQQRSTRPSRRLRSRRRARRRVRFARAREDGARRARRRGCNRRSRRGRRQGPRRRTARGRPCDRAR